MIPEGRKIDAMESASQPAPQRLITADSLTRDLVVLRRRLVREATSAISMIENSLEALWSLDRTAAKAVRRSDDQIDDEEVAIESECFRLLALHQPFARDLRALGFILKVNADLERVADHACSIARIAGRIKLDRPPVWPVSLVELGKRVPPMCHELLRAVLDEDIEGALAIIDADEALDQLDRQVYFESVELMERDPDMIPVGPLVVRASRELERIGDLMCNIAEDVVYLATGRVIRHGRHAEESA